MGLLKKLFRRQAAVQDLPSGSLTVDRNGNTITSTISSTYPAGLLKQIAKDVLKIFSEARDAQSPLHEVNIHFASLRVTARELRGGAIIFLFPQIAMPQTHNKSLNSTTAIAAAATAATATAQ
ncbi:MAG TPA: hypothetical protein VNV43_13415 [Candidatus Acidoferrales bacterium]|jgi:hypothetical protein|nr:hypothetical protein [Candidatus Acidoferrales bacterium]